MIELENDRRFLYQWALDQRVQIDNFLPGTWVEFSTTDTSKNVALITEAYEECGHVFANIPNVLLQTFGYLRVIVTPPATDMVHTPEERDFKIVRRQKPSHYIYTETPTVSYASKVNLFWGTEHAGKAVVVGKDGYLTASGKTIDDTIDDTIASDDEVNDMFDNVFNENGGANENPGGDGSDSGDDTTGGNTGSGDDNTGGNTGGTTDGDIATDEEVEDMFDDVFG